MSQTLSPTLTQTAPPGTAIRWPEQHAPARASVFVHNELVIPTTPDAIWPWLLKAEGWPAWYPNADNIHFLSHTGPNLRDRSRFRWKTFGFKVTSKVREFEPRARLAWDFHGIGVEGYHAWVLTEQAPIAGVPQTLVVMEETQTGWLARLRKKLTPTRMHTMHQLWLENLSHKAQSGTPS